MQVRGVLFDCAATSGRPSDEGDPGPFLQALHERGIPAAVAPVSKAPGDGWWAIVDELPKLEAARAAGYRTACVLGAPGSERLQNELRQASDILVHGFAELTVPLLQDYADAAPADALSGELEVLIVDGSPERSSARLVSQLAASADYVIAADRGADVLFEAGVAPDVFCGDADTVAPEAAAWAREQADSDIRYPQDKYETDLGLALACARHEAARRHARLSLTLTCASGGKPDHALAVMGIVADNADARPRIVEDGFECRILSPEGAEAWDIGAARGRTFSAIALRDGTVVSERGSKWELDHAQLGLLADTGISNVVAADACRVTCHAGVVAVFLR